ncbi:hypothetical protein CVT26_000526 [Gymnopilus dilepis]|uniref:ER membrane protein complex subunit 2 n=1 Tax=Gymnopilus dilepis TaxID=231916 RepID=A0A409VH47_9AGAR|nr:hypothetical protein CVT26_000526 [Gymnopilus dilepis]
MSSSDHIFLFSSLESKGHSTARKVHLRRLYDILQLSIQRHDFERAKRIWGILAGCKEIDWKALWTTGLHILGENKADERHLEVSIDYLRAMMLQSPEDQEAILKELVFRLLLQGRCRDALDELELYLPSLPYQDNPILHIYAGLASLYLAQQNSAPSGECDRASLREAQNHLDHAKVLDPDNSVVAHFTAKVRMMPW